MVLRSNADSVLVHDDSEDRIYGHTRRRVFAVTGALALVTGLGFTLLQSPVYQSRATVLMSAPVAIDEQMLDADVQGVAIQRRTLTGAAVTERLARHLGDSAAINLSPRQIRSLLRVEGVPETNLLELSAVGDDRQLLPLLVESWLEVYGELRSREIRAQKDATLQQVQSELDGFASKVEDARQALEAYRREHQIISMEREQNAVLAKLDGLNSALNNAVENEVKARAYLDTLRNSLAAGERLVPQSERSDVASMAEELTELRARLAELRARYTEDYIGKDPRLREIPERVTILEQQLENALDRGARLELANAERDYRAAQQAVADLEARLDDHKAAVARFNSVYATHQALVEDLASLEQLNRDTQARQVEIQVREVERYPQITVIDWPAPEATRIGPNYLWLLGGTLGGSLILAIFAVWLHGFLHPRRSQPSLVAVTRLGPYNETEVQALGQDAPTAAALDHTRDTRLPGPAADDGENDSGDGPGMGADDQSPASGEPDQEDSPRR